MYYTRTHIKEYLAWKGGKQCPGQGARGEQGITKSTFCYSNFCHSIVKVCHSTLCTNLFTCSNINKCIQTIVYY